MQIILKSVDELTPYDRNPRRNDRAVDKVAASIKEFGFKAPIVIDTKNEIVCGHTRYKASQKLNLTQVPCIMADDLTPDQIKAYRLADNMVAEFSEWNNDLLTIELADIPLDMTEFGFADPAGDDNTEAEEDNYDTTPPAEPTVSPGDLYYLGEHRLLVGDATKPEDMARLMGDAQADLVLTDPPYNVNYADKEAMLARSTKYGNDRVEKGHAVGINNDHMADTEFHDFLNVCFANVHAYTKPGGAAYIFHAGKEAVNFITTFRNHFNFYQTLIWVKHHLVLGRLDYHYRHEPILYGYKEGAKRYFTDDRTNTTVIEDKVDFKKLTKAEAVKMLQDIYEGQAHTDVLVENKPERSELHPTTKPIKLLARLIRNSSRQGEVVLDCFLGSGSTMIACEQLGRKCYGMELDPKYAQAAIDRYIKFKGTPDGVFLIQGDKKIPYRELQNDMDMQ